MSDRLPLYGFEPFGTEQPAPDWVVVPGSFEAAKRALDIVVTTIGREPWVRGARVEGDSGAYRVVVEVSTSGARDIIATKIEGVPIEVLVASGETK